MSESDNLDVEWGLGLDVFELEMLEADLRSEEALRRRDAATEYLGDPGLVADDDG
jgi:hypothetical protein